MSDLRKQLNITRLNSRATGASEAGLEVRFQSDPCNESPDRLVSILESMVTRNLAPYETAFPVSLRPPGTESKRSYRFIFPIVVAGKIRQALAKKAR